MVDAVQRSEDGMEEAPVEDDEKSLDEGNVMNDNNKKGHQLLDEGIEIERKAGDKAEGDSEEEDCVPPALPPRPPPRSRETPQCHCTCNLAPAEDEFQNFRRSPSRSCWASGLRKYVFLCTACGSLSILLGTLFLTVYFMLKSYTSSLNHFETIPTYIPSGMLIATGFLIICLACRKNRNSFLMKLCGLCSLCCAVLCVSVTVTTTVIHMNRLQTLRECLYTQKTQSCTCYSVLMDNDRTSDEGIKFVFNSTPDCEVIHGALYSCLRAIFGLSVIGILVCIFSCMLVYQLLSHEKKKMYWAQLEMRCRYLYRQQRNPHYCSCCDECRYPPPPHEIFPWELMGNRFWSSGRIGNLYTPNPEDRDGNSRLRSGWNWRRLPWYRSGSNANEPSRANLGSPDSQYGFSSTPTVDGAPYTVRDPRATNCLTTVPLGTDITEGGFYSWGPPPPYASNRNSANNSPARRSLGDILHHVSPIRRNDNVSPIRPYHHIHHHHVHHPHSANHQCSSTSRQAPIPNLTAQNSLQQATQVRPVQVADVLQQQRNNLRSNSLTSEHKFQKIDQTKGNYENTYEADPSSNGFNTLPSLKKRNQTRASDLFQNETTSGYYFSSAENLGCAESNNGNENQFTSDNLPPRVFLMNDTTHGTAQRFDGFQQNESEHENISKLGNDSQSRRTPENSFVKKLFVSCSPTKQKHRVEGESLEKRDGSLMVNKKKVSKRLAGKKDLDPSNENVITFHYRLGIPRSPNIQNFNQFAEKSGKEEDKEEMGEQWNGETPEEIEECQENQKVLKGLKYVSKDMELLQKHGSLMKEFSKNVDLQKNLKYMSEKSNRSNSGVDNKGFQNMEGCGRFSRSSDKQECRAIKGNFNQGEMDQTVEEFPAGKNENESDVYFGDISNSSCYVSIQNEGVDSSLYEEAVEHRNTTPVFPTSGQSLLNKQNLKRIEGETAGFNEVEREQSDNQTFGKLQSEVESYQQNYRNRRPSPFRYEQPDPKKEDGRVAHPEHRPQDSFPKSQRRPFLGSSNYSDLDNNGKCFNSGCYQDHYRPSEQYQEPGNSNDEHSSSSLTIDSGISTGRNYLPRCYEPAYPEMDCTGKSNAENSDGTCFETLNERFSNIEKFQPLSNLDSLGDFSHPLFQKPKLVPRGNRYKDSDGRQKKGKELEAEEASKGRKVKGELPEHADLPEDKCFQKPKGEETRKSPKPLPRTGVGSGLEAAKHGKYSKEKHFLAPDAQYEGFKKSQTKKLDGLKPTVPARPLNLEERCRNSKMDGFVLRDSYCRTESGCSRRVTRGEESEDKDSTEIGNHSVNV